MHSKKSTKSIAYRSCRYDVVCGPCVCKLVEVDSLTSQMTRRQSCELSQYTSHCHPAAALAAPTATQHNSVMHADDYKE